MKPLLRTGSLEQHEEMDREFWAESTPEERFSSVEAIRQSAWKMYGQPIARLERVLVVADFPPREISVSRRARSSDSRKTAVHGRPRRIRRTK